MQIALGRRYATAGVALVGAAVIAVSPIAPPMPDIQVPSVASIAVQLAANPTYAEVLARTSGYATAVINDFFGQYGSDSTPIQKVISNQIALAQSIIVGFVDTADAIGTALTTAVPQLLQAALADLASFNIYGAANNLFLAALAPLAPLLLGAIPIQAAAAFVVHNMANAFGYLTNPLLLGLSLIAAAGPLISGASAALYAFQSVLDAAGNPQQMMTEIINSPAAIMDGFLNGGYGPDMGALLGLSGLFSGGLLTPTLGASLPAWLPPGGMLFGPIGAFLELREQLANQLDTAPTVAALAAAGKGAAATDVVEEDGADVSVVAKPPASDVAGSGDADASGEAAGAAETDGAVGPAKANPSEARAEAKAERQAKKAERPAKKAERQAKKAERQAKKAAAAA
jgi:hypothetical protein